MKEFLLYSSEVRNSVKIILTAYINNVNATNMTEFDNLIAKVNNYFGISPSTFQLPSTSGAWLDIQEKQWISNTVLWLMPMKYAFVYMCACVYKNYHHAPPPTTTHLKTILKSPVTTSGIKYLTDAYTQITFQT